jgi:hypothetical protein
MASMPAQAAILEFATTAPGSFSPVVLERSVFRTEAAFSVASLAVVLLSVFEREIFSALRAALPLC